MKMSNKDDNNMVVYEGIKIGKAVQNKNGDIFLEVKKPGENVYTKIPVLQLVKDIINKAEKAG